MDPFKMSLHELVTIGAIIISVTTAYVLLNTDVKAIKEDIVDLKVSIDAVQREQFRVNFLLHRREDRGLSDEDNGDLQRALEKKPWRTKK